MTEISGFIKKLRAANLRGGVYGRLDVEQLKALCERFGTPIPSDESADAVLKSAASLESATASIPAPVQPAPPAPVIDDSPRSVAELGLPTSAVRALGEYGIKTDEDVKKWAKKKGGIKGIPGVNKPDAKKLLDTVGVTPSESADE